MENVFSTRSTIHTFILLLASNSVLSRSTESPCPVASPCLAVSSCPTADMSKVNFADICGWDSVMSTAKLCCHPQQPTTTEEEDFDYNFEQIKEEPDWGIKGAQPTSEKVTPISVTTPKAVENDIEESDTTEDTTNYEEVDIDTTTTTSGVKSKEFTVEETTDITTSEVITELMKGSTDGSIEKLSEETPDNTMTEEITKPMEESGNDVTQNPSEEITDNTIIKDITESMVGSTDDVAQNPSGETTDKTTTDEITETMEGSTDDVTQNPSEETTDNTTTEEITEPMEESGDDVTENPSEEITDNTMIKEITEPMVGLTEEITDITTTTSVSVDPMITYITPDTVSEIGSTVDLECTVQNAEEYSVVWMKVDPEDARSSTTISVGELLLIGGFSLSVETVGILQSEFQGIELTTYKLQIMNIAEQDVGIYQCQIMVSVENRITAEVSLTVPQPPTSPNAEPTTSGNSLNPCDPSPCGEFSQCRINLGQFTPECTCLPTYTGQPPYCRQEPLVSGDSRKDPVMKTNSTENDGAPTQYTVRPKRPEETTFTTNPEVSVTTSEDPTNPCYPSPCGKFSECRINLGESKAECSCLPNYRGQPPNCIAMESFQNESTTSPKTVKTTAAPYVNPCDPSPCGEFSECSINLGESTAECSCLPNYSGQPPNCRRRPECGAGVLCREGHSCVAGGCVKDNVEEPSVGSTVSQQGSSTQYPPEIDERPVVQKKQPPVLVLIKGSQPSYERVTPMFDTTSVMSTPITFSSVPSKKPGNKVVGPSVELSSSEVFSFLDRFSRRLGLNIAIYYQYSIVNSYSLCELQLPGIPYKAMYSARSRDEAKLGAARDYTGFLQSNPNIIEDLGLKEVSPVTPTPASASGAYEACVRHSDCPDNFYCSVVTKQSLNINHLNLELQHICEPQAGSGAACVRDAKCTSGNCNFFTCSARSKNKDSLFQWL